MNDIVGGLIEAKQIVEQFTYGRDEFEIVVDQAGNTNDVELSALAHAGTVALYYSFKEPALPVVLIRALTPTGFQLATIEDFPTYAEGTYTRTVAPTPAGTVTSHQ